MPTSVGSTGAVAQQALEQQQRSVNKSMGKEEFLNILVAQLSNQDPLNPTNDTEFIAQMAQFSVLEQLQTLNTTMSATQAYSMVGKWVYIKEMVDGVETLGLGKVDGIINENGVSKLVIGDKKYDIADVVGVVDVQNPNTTLEEMIAQGASLIGKTVAAKYTDAEGNAVTAAGVVDKVIIKDSSVYVIVDGQEVPLASITEVEA